MSEFICVPLSLTKAKSETFKMQREERYGKTRTELKHIFMTQKLKSK